MTAIFIPWYITDKIQQPYLIAFDLQNQVVSWARTKNDVAFEESFPREPL